MQLPVFNCYQRNHCSQLDPGGSERKAGKLRGLQEGGDAEDYEHAQLCPGENLSWPSPSPSSS